MVVVVRVMEKTLVVDAGAGKRVLVIVWVVDKSVIDHWVSSTNSMRSSRESALLRHV